MGKFVKEMNDSSYVRGFQDAVDLIQDEASEAKNLEDVKKIIRLVSAEIRETMLRLVAEVICHAPHLEVREVSQ